MRTALQSLAAVAAFSALAAAAVVHAQSQPMGRCGGPHGAQCRPSEYCRIDPPFGVDKTGICTQRPTTCPKPRGHEAVCGRNGQTYPNRCSAAKAGVNFASDGPCRRVWHNG
ncbi:MAG TPA: Kazal-type serine protease inhibitor [Caulobacteraceae bacterium]|jgi:hypothetical protein